MYLSPSEQEDLRLLCKDEEAYEQLLELLSRKKSREEEILEQLPSPMVLVDATDDNSPIVYVNPAFEALTGYSKKDIIGKNPRFLHEADHQQAGLDKIREAIHQGQGATATIRNYRRDKTLFWNQMRLFPIHNNEGNLTYYLSSHEDVTAEVEAHDKTQVIDHIYGYFIDNTLDMIAIYTPDGELIYANPAVTRTLGYTIAEFRQLSSADRVHPDDLDYTLDQVNQSLLAGKTLSQLEYRMLKKDGDYINVESYSTPIYDEKGNLTHLLAIARDISERIHRSEQQFRTLVENNPDGIERLNYEGRFLYVNTALAKAWGGMHPEDIIGKTNEELGVVSPLLEELEQARYAVFDSGEVMDIEFSYDAGSILHIFQARLVPEFDIEGNVETILGIVRDITESRQSEVALQESEARANALLDALPDMVFHLSREGEYLDIYGNRDKLRVEADQLIGKQIADYFGIDLSNKFTEAIARTLGRNETQTINYEINSIDGSFREHEARLIASHEDAVIALVRDVTDEKQLQEALRQSEARANALLDAIPDMVFHLSREGEYLDFRAKRKNLYAPDAQLIGTKISDYFEADLSKQILDAISKTLANHEMQSLEYQLDIPEKGLQYYEARMVASGEDEVIIVVRNIANERKTREHEMSIALESERTAILSQFIQTASHEFRTPLSVITTNLHMLGQLNDKARRKQKIERINKQVLQLNTLIDMQLLMTKLDSGIVMSRQPLSVANTIDMVLVKLDHKCKVKNLHFQTDIRPDGLRVRADEEHIHKALLQLVDNAIRYSRDGDDIYIRAYPVDNTLLIEIEDKGIGIDADEIEHLFERFWRKDKIHTAAGLGLGLPLAQKIIELHDGDIEVSSELNQGSIFTIKLPL